MSLETASTVIARKAFICDAYHCDNMIDPGEEYARHVAFPGHDANDGSTPWVMRICWECQSPAPMPPRRTRKVRSGGGNATEGHAT